MRWILQKQINKILLKKLNGHLDLVNYILKFNDDSQSIIDWYIEKDFYNWLTYDTFDRNFLILNRIEYFNINCTNKLNYYIDNYNDLGLTKYKYKYRDYDGLRRIKSLTNCFNSSWWKTTEKNFIYWDLIHIHINYLNYPY